MKQPEQCLNMEDIRHEIDTLDRQIIAALGQRFEYVKAAANFKSDVAAVKASERFKTMLEQRRKWAEIENLNPDVIEKIYKDLVEYFIHEELKEWKNDNQ
ncbi:MAG TPA: isochorismate lyase [Coleofasciculaceae cyanobacterium]|jgi:isochorismate pyruvate lyase